MTTSQELKTTISNAYSEKLRSYESCCNDGDACGTGYPVELVGSIPEDIASFGCGSPTASARLQPGERVLDLGSGAGLDCFLAAREVAPGGQVIGVDFTTAMIDKAREHATRLGITNVSFRLGDIEDLPVKDNSIDVVISNCVINLAPDKDAVLREAYRVLSIGGRLIVSDVVLTRPATKAEGEDMALLTGCISGSLPVDEYLAKIRAAGFENVSLDNEGPPGDAQYWFSAAISATRP